MNRHVHRRQDRVPQIRRRGRLCTHGGADTPQRYAAAVSRSATGRQVVRWPPKFELFSFIDVFLQFFLFSLPDVSIDLADFIES